MKTFEEILERTHCTDEFGRLDKGDIVVSFRRIETFEELTGFFSQADDEIRQKRAEVFYNADNIRKRRKIGQGIHDRSEKIIFAYGEALSESDIAGLSKHLPHPVKFVTARELHVKKDEIFDLTASCDDFGLRAGDDLLCLVNIGTLILEDGARVRIRGNLLSFSCQKVIKRGKSEHDIEIMPTSFSYGQSYIPCGIVRNGEDGSNGKNGADGNDLDTPELSAGIFGMMHFGDERGVKNGGDGCDGENGTNGNSGLCGGAAKIAEINIGDIELCQGVPLCIFGKAGDGSNGGNGGDGGNGGNGGSPGNAYDVYTPERILKFEAGSRGNGGNGGNGGRGGNGGNGGICSDIFVEVPDDQIGRVICISDKGHGGTAGCGGKGGIGGNGSKSGMDGRQGSDGKNGHDRPGPPIYINSVLYTQSK